MNTVVERLELLQQTPRKVGVMQIDLDRDQRPVSTEHALRALQQVELGAFDVKVAERQRLAVPRAAEEEAGAAEDGDDGEDEETDELIYTDVGCDLLEAGTCRCTDYPNRNKRVPDCIPLTPDNIEDIDWMPPSCAYRRLKEGRGLAWWHPLRSGEYRTVIEAGMSVQGRFVYESDVKDDIEDHEASWPFDDRDELGDEAD